MIAKVGCDIHERGALTMMNVFRDAGFEVIYTGRYQAEASVAREVTLRQHFLSGGQPYWNVDRLFTEGLSGRIAELKKLDD